jgi:hypothetical protein
VSEAEIQQLVDDRSLARETFTDEQVAFMWGKGAASYADALVPGLSSDGAFQHLYTAALQATIATLAAHGLRVKSTANHYKAFYALQKLDGALAPHGRVFDEMRGTRNDSIYGVNLDETDLAERLAEALAHLPEAMTTLRTAILAARPGIAARLPRVP